MAQTPTYQGPMYTGYGTTGTGGPVNGAAAPYDANAAMAQYQKILGSHFVSSQGQAQQPSSGSNTGPYMAALGSAVRVAGPKGMYSGAKSLYNTGLGAWNKAFAPDQSAAETARLNAVPDTTGGTVDSSGTNMFAGQAPAGSGEAAADGTVAFSQDPYAALAADSTTPDAYAGLNAAVDPYEALLGGSAAGDAAGSVAGAGGAADAAAMGAIDYTGADLAIDAGIDYAAADAAAYAAADAALYDGLGELAIDAVALA